MCTFTMFPLSWFNKKTSCLYRRCHPLSMFYYKCRENTWNQIGTSVTPLKLNSHLTSWCLGRWSQKPPTSKRGHHFWHWVTLDKFAQANGMEDTQGWVRPSLVCPPTPLKGSLYKSGSSMWIMVNQLLGGGSNILGGSNSLHATWRHIDMCIII